MSNNQITTIQENALNGLRNAIVILLDNNALNQEAIRMIQRLQLNNISFDMVAHDITSQNIQELIEQLSPNAQQNALNFLTKQYDVTIDTGETQKFTLQDFLEKVMQTTYYNDAELKQKVTLPALEHMLGTQEDQKEIDDKIVMAMQSLGNCATPVNQFIVQEYIGLKAKNGEKIEPEIAEKCAVREKVLQKLNKEINGNGGDRTETVESLLNELFNNNETKITGKKNTSESVSQYSLPVSQELFDHFARLVCKTNNGNLLIDNGKYIRDDAKVYAITRNFLEECGFVDENTKIVNEYATKLEDLTKKNQNRSKKIKNLLHEFYCSDTSNNDINRQIEKLINIKHFKNELSRRLENTTPKQQSQIAETFFRERVSKLEALHDKISVRKRQKHVNKTHYARMSNGKGFK